MFSIFKLSKKLSVILLLSIFGSGQEARAGGAGIFGGLMIAALAATPLAVAVTGIVAGSIKVHKARMMRQFYSDKDADGKLLPDGEEQRLVTDEAEVRQKREGQLIKWGIILGLSCLAFFPTLNLALGGVVGGVVTGGVVEPVVQELRTRDLSSTPSIRRFNFRAERPGVAW